MARFNDTTTNVEEKKVDVEQTRKVREEEEAKKAERMARFKCDDDDDDEDEDKDQ